MILSIKNKIMALIVSIVFVSGLTTAIAPSVYAATSENAAADQICQGLSQADGSTGCDSVGTGKTANGLIKNIINLFSWIIGVIAVIMIIFAGFRFVTSSGDSGKVTSARQTIIYALIGLVVVALAQTIVKFVLGQFIK